MTSEERECIFEFAGVDLLPRLEKSTDQSQSWIMTETIGFLAAFNVPLEPFLRRLLDSPSAQVRANVCVFMAEHVWGQQPFQNKRLKALTPLPENQVALSNFLSTGTVAAFLMEHASDASIFGIEPEAYVGLAFDWAVSRSPLMP